jgi:seryl-tRNA synthetase
VDLEKQNEFSLKIRDQVNEVHDAVNQIRDTRAQLQALRKRLADEEKYKALVSAAEALDKKMTSVEGELLQVKAQSSEANLNFPVMVDERLHSLAGSVDMVDAAPTKQQYEVFDVLSQQAKGLVGRWKEIQASDLAALNEQARKDGLQVIYLSNPK